MKTLTALLTAFLLVLTSSLYTQDDFKLGFTGAYPQYYDYNTTKNINWQNYHDMGMNQWQGWWIGDNWHTNATEEVLEKLADEDIDGWLQPDTIRWAGYGRVQVNEAENDNDLRFNYTDHHGKGIPITDNWQNTTQRVQFYEAIPNGPETAVLTGISENGFQSFSGIHDPVYQVPFPYNDYLNPNYPLAQSTSYYNFYYVKPRMRVNVGDVNNNAPNKEVVKIIVNKFNGQLADSLTIYTNDFKNSQGIYDGSYKEDYRDYSLIIRGDILNSIGQPNGRLSNNPFEYLDDCHVDYQVYWYGEVSVWIDYVKVMDEAAYRLFHPDPCKRWRFEHLLQKPLN